MHKLEELREMLMKELEECTKKGLSSNSLDIIDKLTHSIKSIDTIMAMGDYSQDSGNSYRRSYRRGRDSMGRYTEGGMSSRYRDNYRDDGYSGDEYTELYETLRSLQQNTRDEGARKMVENWLKEMR